MGRLLVLSGPSCVGKGPLYAALGKFYPGLAAGLRQTVLYNSRQPRPHEVDGEHYHFRPRVEIEALGTSERYMLMDVRGDLQALDLQQLEDDLARGDVFFEGNPFVGRTFLSRPPPVGCERVSAFLSPLSRAEIVELRDRGVAMAEFVTNVMRFKLLRRTRKQKEMLALKDLENIERRAGSAWAELHEAWRFDWVIPNHDAEGSENWEMFYYPIGDARRALLAMAAILQGEEPVGAEKWEEALL